MSRGLYWILAPILFVCGVSFPFLMIAAGSWTVGRILGAIAFELVMIGLILGLYDPFRFVNGLRVVAGIIFLFYVVYVIDMIASPLAPLAGASRSQPSLLNALAGLIVWGIPSFLFMKNGKRWLGESEDDLGMILFASSNPHKLDEVAAILEEVEVFIMGLDELGQR